METNFKAGDVIPTAVEHKDPERIRQHGIEGCNLSGQRMTRADYKLLALEDCRIPEGLIEMTNACIFLWSFNDKLTDSFIPAETAGTAEPERKIYFAGVFAGSSGACL